MGSRLRVLAGFGVAVGTALSYLIVRPRLLSWGATTEDVGRAMPGDDAVTDPHVLTTRAVTIAARPEDVWPWLVQIGYRRGGLYSYDWLDRLFGVLDRPSADVILPEFQNLKVGDVIPMGSGPSWPVTVCVPEKALVVVPVKNEVSWCFGLYPLGEEATRFVSRVRVRVGSKPLLTALAPVVDLPWFAMERKMLLGIARRSEALARTRRAFISTSTREVAHAVAR